LGAFGSVLEKFSIYPLDRRLSGSWNWSACNGGGEVLVDGWVVGWLVVLKMFPAARFSDIIRENEMSVLMKAAIYC